MSFRAFPRPFRVQKGAGVALFQTIKTIGSPVLLS